MRRAAILLGLAVLLAGCDRSMTQQKRYDTYAAATIWPDGTSARPLPEHVVAQGDLARHAAAARPPPATPQVLARGRERFGIFCAPCHGVAGDGDGVIVQRGFPAPPSFHLPRLRAATAAHIYGVISEGYGAMYPYAARIKPRDRWAIIAYVRALQLQRHAALALAPEAREKLP
jgi:mono/diheme cytochrome c family protein